MNPEKRLSLFIVSFIAAAILAAIVYFKPHFGLMDDHNMIYSVVPAVDQVGLLRACWDFAIGDIVWGMFRFMYPLMVYVLYKPALMTAPWVLFFLNALVVFAIFYFWARILERITKVPFWSTLICSATFFYGYDLFQHPSLQEKLVLVFGALIVWLVDSEKTTKKRHALVLLVAILGMVSKASFFIYLATAVFILWIRSTSLRQALLRSLPLISLTVLGAILTAIISSQGGYTKVNYSWLKAIPNLISRDGLFIVLPTLLLILLIVISRSWKKNLGELVPIVSVLAFFAIFLPWGVAAYIQTVIAPIMGCIIALVASKLFVSRHKLYWVIPCGLLALTVGSYRSVTMFGRLGDLRQIVEQIPNWKVQEFWMPCWEGADAMQLYLKKKGLPVAVRRMDHQDWGKLKEIDGRIVLHDAALCSFPGRVMNVPGCQSESLFRGLFTKSFQVERLSCK